MTVGIAAIAKDDSDNQKVVMSSDRMVTTQQQSAIEHEHPETKLSILAPGLENSHFVGIIAGSIQWGETLKNQIEVRLAQFAQENNQDPWVDTAAQIAGESYRVFVQEKIENVVLQPYGLELDDLQRQHQFKDDFFGDILSEANQVRQELHQGLTLLLGGVGAQGAGIYQIAANDVIPQNDMGYATIGSGTQPAESEFIKSEYGRNDDLETAFATVAAAHYQAKKASGVGGDPDIMVVDENGVHEVSPDISELLMDRQDRIASEQETIRDNILSEERVDWSPE